MLGCRQIFLSLKGAVNLKRLKNTELDNIPDIPIDGKISQIGLSSRVVEDEKSKEKKRE